MPLLNTILATTAFNTPLYSTLVPTIALAYTLQTLAAIPSIIFRTTRLFHLSGSFTHIACTLLSLFLPYLRARALGAFQGGLKDYLTSPAPGQRWWFWRQAVLSAAVVTWGFRCTCWVSYGCLVPTNPNLDRCVAYSMTTRGLV